MSLVVGKLHVRKRYNIEVMTLSLEDTRQVETEIGDCLPVFKMNVSLP